jgi:Raf kinase inhibitor-like YbhB/YbcL family protein
MAGDDFAITSSAAAPTGKMPDLYTCSGKNISPPLAWHGAPEKTQAYALIVADPDAPAGTFYHWVLFNIPKTTKGIAANSSPNDTLIGDNSTHQPGYHGPCPPPGPSPRYVFNLYALDAKLDLPADADADAVTKAMEKHVLKHADYTMVFNR